TNSNDQSHVSSEITSSRNPPAKIEPEVSDLDEDEPEADIKIFNDSSEDEESQNETAASSDFDSNSDFDTDIKIFDDSSEDKESQNEIETNSSSSDSESNSDFDTDIKIFDDESDVECEEESKNEMPKITDEQFFAALGYFGYTIGTEDGQSDRSGSIDHPKHDVKRILREEITRSEGILVQA
ncbi:hypothetical protein C1646_779129, partial [Rhizophagus diaphanus]